MQEINLLQKESEPSGGFTFNVRHGGHMIFYLVLALLVVEILVYLFLGFLQRQANDQIMELAQRSVNIDLEISKIDEGRKQAISAQGRLKNLESLLASHLFWSKVFTELENRTYKPIRLKSLQVNQASSRFVLTGFSPTQTDIAKFMVGLETSPYIQNVTLRSAAAQQGKESGYTFNMDIAFDPKLLRR